MPETPLPASFGSPELAPTPVPGVGLENPVMNPLANPLGPGGGQEMMNNLQAVTSAAAPEMKPAPGAVEASGPKSAQPPTAELQTAVAGVGGEIAQETVVPEPALTPEMVAPQAGVVTPEAAAVPETAAVVQETLNNGAAQPGLEVKVQAKPGEGASAEQQKPEGVVVEDQEDKAKLSDPEVVANFMKALREKATFYGDTVDVLTLLGKVVTPDAYKLLVVGLKEADLQAEYQKFLKDNQDQPEDKVKLGWLERLFKTFGEKLSNILAKKGNSSLQVAAGQPSSSTTLTT